MSLVRRVLLFLAIAAAVFFGMWACSTLLHTAHAMTAKVTVE